MIDLGDEMDVAARVRRERKARGMSYRELADAMAAEGCSIQASALQRLESGYPKRPDLRPKVGINELTALCKVFDIRPDDLLMPIRYVSMARARELAEERVQAMKDFWDSAQRVYQAAQKARKVADEWGDDAVEASLFLTGDRARPPAGLDPAVYLALWRAVSELTFRGYWSYEELLEVYDNEQIPDEDRQIIRNLIRNDLKDLKDALPPNVREEGK